MSLKMKYFVLKPAGDDDYAIASRRALQAYGQWISQKAIENNDPEMEQLGRDVTDWAFHEHGESIKRRQASKERNDER
jgi:hypothetical protein